MNQSNIKLDWYFNGKMVHYYFTTDLYTLEIIKADLRAKGYDVIAYFGRIYDDNGV